MFGFCNGIELYNCQHRKLLAFNEGGGFTNNSIGSFWRWINSEWTCLCVTNPSEIVVWDVLCCWHVAIMSLSGVVGSQVWFPSKQCCYFRYEDLQLCAALLAFDDYEYRTQIPYNHVRKFICYSHNSVIKWLCLQCCLKLFTALLCYRSQCASLLPSEGNRQWNHSSHSNTGVTESRRIQL